jgi:hypothetical protein
MKNEDVVILVNPNNNIFYCYTESEFQRILNEIPPFVIQGSSKVIAVERQEDPDRTFWVYKTQFGYINKTLYNGYMSGSRTFKMVPSSTGTELIFKNSNLEIGDLHDYPATVHNVIPIDRDALLSAKGEIVKDESIVVSEGKHQEIKEREDILPDEEDELFDENEIREYLEKPANEKQKMLSVKREKKKRIDEIIKKLQDKRAEEMKKKIEKRKQAGKHMIAKDPEEQKRLFEVAVREGNLEHVKYGIEMGVDPRMDNDWPLQSASTNGHLELVKYFLENGADIHADNDNSLIWASKNGHVQVVKYLLENGADIHAENDEALNSAASYGRLEVVKFLVKNGANVHAKNNRALRNAIDNDHENVASYLRSLP